MNLLQIFRKRRGKIKSGIIKSVGVSKVCMFVAKSQPIIMLFSKGRLYNTSAVPCSYGQTSVLVVYMHTQIS